MYICRMSVVFFCFYEKRFVFASNHIRTTENDLFLCEMNYFSIETICFELYFYKFECIFLKILDFFRGGV